MNAQTTAPWWRNWSNALPDPLPPDLAEGPVCLVAKGLAGASQPEDAPAAVLINQGRIEALGQEALTSGAKRLLMPELWLSPAPLDAHVHLLMRSSLDNSLDEFYRAGIAGVRDLGNRPVDQTPLARPGQAPIVRASGPGLCIDGPGYCWLAHKLSTPEQFAIKTRQAARAGADVIKVFVSGLLSFEQPGEVEHPNAVGGQQLAAVVDEANAAGLPVAVHASGIKAVGRAVRCGVHSVEHGYFLDEPTWAMMARQRVSWVPTIAPIVTHAEDHDGRHNPETLAVLRKIVERQTADLIMADSLGVDLVLGTDAGSYGLPHEQAVRREIDIWVKAGLDPLVVFQAATLRSAKLLGLEGELGAIKPGARAWLLGLDNDPKKEPLLLCAPAWRSF